MARESRVSADPETLPTDGFPRGRRVHCDVSSTPDRKQHMSSLVLKMSVSLDGYVAAADGSGD